MIPAAAEPGPAGAVGGVEHPCAATFPFPERASMPALTDEELWTLSYYRASEMAGAVVMNRMAARAEDDELRARLTWHFAEEARHAWRWTEVIRLLGCDPLPVKETYQSNYFSRVGIPHDEIELLAITYVFERRVAWHFTLHRRLPGLHPLIAATLATMCSEESPHLHWIRDRLDAYAESGDRQRERVEGLLHSYEAIDREVARAELERFVERGWELPAFALQEL